ncbi:MAG: hypothetical protein AAFU80_16775 [Pseudomonadota bacterium]
MKVPTRIAVYAGTFDSQPLVFAHLLDVAPGLDLDHVEVISGDPRARLAHAFERPLAEALEDALGLATTCVLIFPEALPHGMRLPDATDMLTGLGTHPGLRHRPDVPGDET